MKRQCEGREMVFDFRTGHMLPAVIYYEYVPGRVGSYRAELVLESFIPRFFSSGNTYDEALSRLQRRLQVQAS